MIVDLYGMAMGIVKQIFVTLCLGFIHLSLVIRFLCNVTGDEQSKLPNLVYSTETT